MVELTNENEELKRKLDETNSRLDSLMDALEAGSSTPQQPTAIESNDGVSSEQVSSSSEVIILTDLRYSDIRVGHTDNTLRPIVSGTRTAVYDINDHSYTNGVLLMTRYYSNNYPRKDSVENDRDDALIAVDYALNSQYRLFESKVVLPMTDSGGNALFSSTPRMSAFNEQPVHVYIYGDGTLLDSMKQLTTEMTFDFSVSVEGVDTLTVKVAGVGPSGGGITQHHVVAFTDPILTK